MKNRKLYTALFTSLLFTLFSGTVFAQAYMHHDDNMSGGVGSSSILFGIMELPFLLIAVVFAFLTANQLKGGKFGKGMQLVAWGFVVMAIGHLHMQIEHFYGVNIFKKLLGELGGTAAWFTALVVTWGLSALGFYSVYKASKA